MSSVETGQMSAVETGQMSAAETGQMSAVEVSEVSTIPMFKSQKSQLWQYHNVQVADRRAGPKSSKMTRNGSRIVVRC